MASLLEDEEERRGFWDTFLNAPTLTAYAGGQAELLQCCFIRFPGDAHGRYAQFKVNLVPDPNNGEITGILTVTDVTEQTVTQKILGKLSVLGCDLIADVGACAHPEPLEEGGFLFLFRPGRERQNPDEISDDLRHRPAAGANLHRAAGHYGKC